MHKSLTGTAADIYTVTLKVDVHLRQAGDFAASLSYSFNYR